MGAVISKRRCCDAQSRKSEIQSRKSLSISYLSISVVKEKKSYIELNIIYYFYLEDSNKSLFIWLIVKVSFNLAISYFHERYISRIKVHAATGNNVDLRIRCRPRYHFDKSSFSRKGIQNGGR